jgi:cation transport regulator ChaB
MTQLGIVSPENLQHLVVGRLAEVLVPLADGTKGIRCGEGDQLIRHIPEAIGPVGRRHRHGEHHAHGAQGATDEAGGPRGGTGRDAVVDQQRCRAGQFQPRAAGAIERRPARQLQRLRGFHRRKLRLGHPKPANALMIEHPDAALSDGPEREFGVARSAQLADHQHIERQAEPPSDPVGDDHPTSGKPEHESVPADPGMLEQPRQAFAGVLAIAESHAPPFFFEAALAVEGTQGMRPLLSRLKATGRSVRVMPARDEMPSTIQRSSKHAQEVWAKVHDSAVETYGEGERAHRTAFSALKHQFEKIGDHWEPKKQKGPSDRGASDRSGRTAGGVDANASKQHLYDVARRLGVPGRSKMSKAQLVEAIQRANDRETRHSRD